MKIYDSYKWYLFTLMLLFLSATSFAQLPDGVDAGQSDEGVSIYQDPVYIIPIVVFIILIVIFYFWQKKSKNKPTED